MRISSCRQSWWGAATDSWVDFRAGELKGACEENNGVLNDGGSLGGRAWVLIRFESTYPLLVKGRQPKG